MEAGIVPFRQQQKKIQARDLASLARAAVVAGIKGAGGELIEGLQLQEVARESVKLMQPDR